jgi:anti-anti-sigma factor
MDAAVARCQVTDTEVDGRPGVAVAGELDAASCRKLAAALARASRLGVPVVLDLDACTFIDSSAVATIMRAVRQSRREGGGLVVCNANGFVGVVIEACGLFSTPGVRHGSREGAPIGRDGANR